MSIKKQPKLESQSKQSLLKTATCKVCFHKIEENSFYYLMNKEPVLCHKCLQTFQPVFNEFKIDGIKCLNIYYYNEKIQEILYQFKGCKDYELKSVFLDYFKNYINNRFKNYIMVPAPSFIKSDEERGFNHVEEMFGILELEMWKCIHKTKQIKQADLTSEERQKINEVLVIDDVDLNRKKVLIVDDVFTTGSTVRAMINLLKEKRPKKIQVLVMSKTIDLDERR